jgi:hypothetical protein
LAGVLVVIGLGLFVQHRRDTGLQEAFESNWKELKKKMPSEWADIAPKKAKETRQFIKGIQKATGDSRRTIRRKLEALVA